MLSDSDSEENGCHTLTINEHFARAFQYKKEREELAKLKEKYGSDYSGSGSSGSDDSEDSEDTEEDSDGEELTPAVDAAILRTLARIRKKDPAIYEGGRNVFEEEHLRTHERAPVIKTRTKDKSKPLTIREAALASALAENASRSPSPEPRLTHVEEQRLLQSEVRAAFHGTVDVQTEDDDDGDGDELLIPRSRTRDEIELEEEEYKAFLEREVGEDLRDLVTVDPNVESGGLGEREDATKSGEGDKVKQSKKKKKGKKERETEMEDKKGREEGKTKQVVKKDNQKSKEEADQEFLMQYILNRGWMDHSSRRVPTYNEITNSPSKSSKRKTTKSQPNPNPDGSGEESEGAEQGGEGGGQVGTLSDEEAFDDLADAFETSYNFRFEEPSAALIPSYPRNLPSARRESTTRKDARERKKDRKEAETKALLEARREEVRRERTLIEAAVAEEDEGDAATESVLEDNGDGSGKKKSKKQQKKEELARLKALKGQELRRKLEMVSTEGGLGRIGEEALAHLDLDADWDPSKHDAQMAKLYDGGDYDIVDDADIEKPTWEDDIDIDNIVPPAGIKSKAELKKEKKKEKKKDRKGRDDGDDQVEDLGVDADEMDADVHGGWNEWDDGEEWEGTEEERKRKVDAYMDEVVNRLGFSGISSHMPTRFHYTSAAPDNYGLTPTEILLATDADLNSYVGLKKMAPYRVDRGGKTKKDWDPMRTQRLKEFREKLRARAGSSYGAAWSLDAGRGFNHRTTEALGEKKKRKGKKERAKSKATATENGGEGPNGEDDGGDENNTHVPSTNAEESSYWKRKRDSDFGSNRADDSPRHAEGVAASRNGGAEDGTPKKKRRRRHKKGSGGTVEVAPS
ncbi:hypothetical protein BDN67DRAFT_966770 [Paxillus ammoniavirescens]|nr:hypothetical protein BDN67DRAFT_966770 [Paxillus ammoniavirescens]